MAKKYIPDNSWLICDKGEKLTQVRVTHSGGVSLYGEHFVSEADAIPNENILPFGKCTITNKPCKFNPLYWDRCNDGAKVNGFKLVFEDAHLICKEGGKIEVEFNVPSGGKLGFLGLAAPLQWVDYNKSIGFVQNRVLYDVENGLIALDNSAMKGYYGEMKANRFMDSQHWQNLSSEHPILDINAPTKPGIDGVYKKQGVYLVDDAKYGSSKISTASYGRELSEKWIDYHLDNGAVMDSHTDALKMANNNGTLKRTVTHVDTKGNMTSKPYNSNGYRKGAGANTIIKIPTTKASQLIGSVRSSISNSKTITTLSNFCLSKGWHNNKANDAIWNFTQIIDDVPAIKTTGKVLGKGTVVVGVVMDGYSIYSAYQEEGEFGDKTQQATGSAIGGAAGGWAGAELGAIVGTAICPGVGTIVGGLVGGALGAFAGSKAGSDFLDWLF